MTFTFRVVQWSRLSRMALVGLATVVSAGCVCSTGASTMAYSRDLRQGDALGMYIGHAINQRTLAMRQQQQSNPSQPVVASGEEPKGE